MSSGQRASPHTQTNSRTVRPVRGSSRLWARRSCAPQRRQLSTPRVIGAVCGKGSFGEDVREFMVSISMNDSERQVVVLGSSGNHESHLNMRRISGQSVLLR
jgi:hypothetical protein